MTKLPRPQKTFKASRNHEELLAQLEKDLQGLERLQAMQSTLIRAIREEVAELRNLKAV